jgi:hypothetical protein
MASEQGGKRLPPYVSYRTFRNFIDQLGPRMPARFDRSYWGAMFSGSSCGHLMGALRFLDLIDEKGQPTERLRPLAAAKGDLRVAVLRDICSDRFSFVFQGSPDPQDATYAQLEEKFTDRFPLKPDVSRKCLKFFIELSHEAGIPLSPFITKRFRSNHPAAGTKTITKKLSTKPVTRSSIVVRANRDKEVPQETGGAPVLSSWDRMLLTKFPTFDPSWSDEVKLKWFTAFDELMKRILNRGEK